MVALSTNGTLVGGTVITMNVIAAYTSTGAWAALLTDISLSIVVKLGIKYGCEINFCTQANVKAPICTEVSYQPWGSWGHTCYRIYCDCPYGYVEYKGGIKPRYNEVPSWDIDELRRQLQ
jgi:hypothetical protein